MIILECQHEKRISKSERRQLCCEQCDTLEDLRNKLLHHCRPCMSGLYEGIKQAFEGTRKCLYYVSRQVCDCLV